MDESTANVEHAHHPKLQFRISSALIGIAIVAVGYRFLTTVCELLLGSLPLIIACFTLGTWWCVQRLFVVYVKHEGHRFTVYMLRLLAWTCGLGIVVLAFLRLRWTSSLNDRKWPRPFPYPDEALLAFHNWLDAMNPVGPGFIKIEGEYYAVLAYLTAPILLLCIILGATLALLTNKLSFVGILAWCRALSARS